MSAESPIREAPIPIRQRQRQQTRDVILEVALAEIAALGLSGIRIEHIARKSGVTRPTVYAHFPTREDFLRELQTRTEASALVQLQTRLDAGHGASLLHTLVDALFDSLASTNENLRRESFALMLREPRPERWLGNDLFAYLCERVSRAQTAGEIATDTAADDLTRVAMTALFGFIVIEGADPARRRSDAHRMLDLLIAPGPDQEEH
ncbi:MAG: helix-turn-helix transcriptional regulator [bacterium]|nr:helix-turn-helix transcriptional regulator [bacterium]